MIAKSNAAGGGDTTEDVIGAFDHALSLNFKSKTCLVYHICDAPSHGS